MTTYKAYILGFYLSAALTFSAFLIVYINSQLGYHIFSRMLLFVLILVLAVIQLCTQLAFFLHLGREEKPHWNLNAFIITISLVLIVVVGSLWIMNHLNYNMSPEQIQKYIKSSDAL
ncbi:MAG: cytochrome o ubiquinol oxidase subunit IV [Candidatus Doudnabacteria bacterium]